MKDINATVLVDLKRTEKQIWRGLQKDARWGIGRARREGLVVEEFSNSEEWDDFYKIYTKIVREGGANPYPLDVLKRDSIISFACKKRKEIIGGVGLWFIDKYDKNIPRLQFIATKKEFWKLQPNNLLYWECIMWCKNKGYPIFDLGGWQVKARGHLEGINKFKEKWGEVVLFHREYPFHVAIGRKLIRNYPTAKHLWGKVKGNRYGIN